MFKNVINWCFTKLQTVWTNKRSNKKKGTKKRNKKKSLIYTILPKSTKKNVSKKIMTIPFLEYISNHNMAEQKEKGK